MTQSGEVDFEAFRSMIGERTRLLALAHVSNALGTVVPVQRFIAEARRHGVPVLLDGAQAVPHLPVDVQELDCDFYCFSGHKMCGPTGIGVLYGRESLLAAMPPWQGGGDMILAVTFERTDLQRPAVEIRGRHAAHRRRNRARRCRRLPRGTRPRADRRRGARAARLRDDQAGRPWTASRSSGTAPEKAAVISFRLRDIHPHDLGTILDMEGVAIRTGHHCAMPVMDFYGVPATARASFAFYNTRAEVDRLVAALGVAQEILG